MNCDNNYSAFVEHSFRRLSLLIHQQDAQHSCSSVSTNKAMTQPYHITSSVKIKKNYYRNKHSLLRSSNAESLQQPAIDKSSHSTETDSKVEPKLKRQHTFMRPPKNQTISRVRSFSHISDPSEVSLTHSGNSSYSPSIARHEPSNLSNYIPPEQSLYDLKLEKDRQNDLREKYNIPSPFQREWLRQPRYVPRERPNLAQVHKSLGQ